MALGEAQVKIVPDLSDFKAELISGINDAMRAATRSVDQAGEKIESAFTEAATTADRALAQIDGNGFANTRQAAQRAGDQVETELSSAARQADEMLSRIDGDNFEEVREQADKAGREIGESLEEGGKRGENALQGFAKSAAFAAATAAIGRFAKSSVDAFADLGETLSKAEVIFGDATSSIVEFGDQAAESMGQSKQAAIAAASDFAIFGGAAGLAGQDLATFSTDLTMLASDLASFSNTTPEEAVLALGAALRGESEPIRRYGVLLDDATLKARALEMGIYDGSGALSQQQRVLAANAEIFAQTGLAQGDFARTSDSLSNSQKTLAAQFADMQVQVGQALAPAMQTAVSIGSDLLGLFSALPKEVQGVTAVLVIAGAGFASASRAIQGLGVAAATANKALGAIGLVITGATLLFSALRDKADEVTPRMQELADSVDSISDALSRGVPASKTLTDSVTELADGSEVLRESMIAAGLDISDLVGAIESGKVPAIQMEQVLIAQAEALGFTAEEAATLRNDLFDLAIANIQAGDKAVQMSKIVTDTGGEMQTAAEKTETYKAALEELERQTALVDDALSAAREQVLAWRDSIIDATLSGAESFNTFEVESTTSIAEFRKALLDSAKNVFEWQNNLLTIAQQTSPEFAGYLADMGLAGAQLVAALAQNEIELEATFDAYVLNATVMNRDFLAEFDQTPAGVQRRMEDIRTTVISALGPLASDARVQALAISDAIMQGLVDGIAAGQTNLAYAAAGMVDVVMGSAKTRAGIRSPSEAFASEVGAPIAEGVADGITRTVFQAKDAMTLLVDDLSTIGKQAVDDLNVSLQESLKTAESAFKEAWSLVAGRRSQEQAAQRVSTAEQRLADAQTGVVTATNAVSSAQAELIRVQTDAEASARDIEQAQRNLTNAQRDLDRANREVTSATDGLREANYALLQVSEHLLEQGPESVANFESIARAAGLESGQIQTLVTRYNDLAAARIAAAEAARLQAEVDRELAQIGRQTAVEQANEAVRQARARRDEIARKGGNLAAAEAQVAQAAIAAANAFAQASGAQGGSRAFAQAQLDVLRFLAAESPWLSDDLAGIIRSLQGVVAMANGAIVRSPTIAMVGEAGDEAVIPLSRPARALALMEDSGLADLARSNSGAIVNIQSATFATPSDADLVAQKVNAAYRARVLVG